jgi:hypothetical protein
MSADVSGESPACSDASSVLSTSSPATPTELLGYFAPSDANVFAGPSCTVIRGYLTGRGEGERGEPARAGLRSAAPPRSLLLTGIALVHLPAPGQCGGQAVGAVRNERRVNGLGLGYTCGKLDRISRRVTEDVGDRVSGMSDHVERSLYLVTSSRIGPSPIETRVTAKNVIHNEHGDAMRRQPTPHA